MLARDYGRFNGGLRAGFAAGPITPDTDAVAACPQW